MQPEIQRGFKLAVPTMMAYFPLGIAFGLFFADAGYRWWLAPIMSLVTYAGSVQFVALSMMTTLHSSILAVFLATLFLALRNSFYGLSLLQRYKTHWLRQFLLIFMLVDAAYITVVANPPKEGECDIQFCFYLSLFMYLAWVSGTFIGALCADLLPKINGLEFILPAFFMVLVIEHYLANRRIISLIAPLFAALVAFLIMPKNFLLLAIIISVALILLIQVTWEKRRNAA